MKRPMQIALLMLLGLAVTLGPPAATTQAHQQTTNPPAHSRRMRPVQPPVILPRPTPANAPVAVSDVSINATVRDGVAETEMSQTFANRSDAVQEGDFLFPIPDGATVSQFAMFDGEKRMDARLLEKDEATRTYEEIVRRRRDPALLTFQGRRLLRARVFPIEPRKERRVTLKLVTVLPREGDAKKYVWTLLGPHLGTTAKPERVSVRLIVDGTTPVGNVYSPTHDVTTRRDSATRIVATWNSDKKELETENPELSIYIAPTTAGKAVALTMLTHNASLPRVASVGGGVRRSGYFLVVAAPALPTVAEKMALPRRIVLVMDRSGSMQGKKIEQARSALRFALGTLRPQDSFNVMTFSDRVESFSPEVVAASVDNVKRAQKYVDDIVADGGTNIHDALKSGLAQFVERGSNNTLLFFTDGLPTVGVTNHDAIVKNAVGVNAKKARVFVFGVGYDVDVPFLDSVATALRGDADYVRPDENIEVKTSQFVAKTKAPVLENLQLTVKGGNVGEMYPRPGDLPDLFAGGQLVITGRYTGASDAGQIALTGEANGKPQTFTLAAKFPAVDTDSDFLPRLWATRKIGYLSDAVRLGETDAQKKEIITQIIELSREFGVLTPYTALFVPEPGTDVTRLSAAGPQGTLRALDIDAIVSHDADNSLVVKPSGAARGGVGGGGFGGGGFGGAGAPPPASAPRGAVLGRAKTGESAVNASQGARSQRGQATVGNSNYYALQAGTEKKSLKDMSRRIQNVQNRAFYQIGTQWTDATFDAKKQKEVVQVKLYSPAYFALARRNAKLAQWAALGENVLVTANAKQAIQFGSVGKESLTEKELDDLAGKAK